MTRWARINNDRVAEITDIDPAGRFHPSIRWVEFDVRKGVKVGWLYDGGEFSGPSAGGEQSIEQWRSTASVSSRQGMEQLIRSGLDEQVDAKIEAIEDPLERKLTRNWINKASTWERNNAQFISLGEALGLTSEDMDDHIKSAAKL